MTTQLVLTKIGNRTLAAEWARDRWPRRTAHDPPFLTAVRCTTRSFEFLHNASDFKSQQKAKPVNADPYTAVGPILVLPDQKGVDSDRITRVGGSTPINSHSWC